MKIAILGTGTVGLTIASKLVELGHEVVLGTRNKELTLNNPKVNTAIGLTISDWLSKQKHVTLCSFSDLKPDVDLIVNATGGMVSIAALEACPSEFLTGKTLIDVANPLDFSNGFPPSLAVCNTDSLAEQIQRRFPETNVVKSLNTMNCKIMVQPRLLEGEHCVFMSGNSDSAKAQTAALLQQFGWRPNEIIDLGPLASARGTEMWLPLWLQLYKSKGHADFNLSLRQ